MPTPSTTPVSDRLDRLAHEAPTRLGDPDELWSRGRRRQRARWAGTAAALVVVAVLGAVAVPSALHRTQDIVADSGGSGLRLPDVIRQPGEWERAFPAAPGPLVAVGVGTRGGWWSSSGALWGVSGVTGESRFLDLPDVAAVFADRPAALSADGRRLAYWLTDDDVEPASTVEDDAITGVAVIDLVNGDVARWDVESERGLSTSGMAWAGDVLWWSGGAVEPEGEDGVPRYREHTHSWDLRTDERRELQRGTRGWDMSLYASGQAPDGFLARAGGGRLRLVQDEEVGRAIRLDSTVVYQQHTAPTMSPGGARLAAILDPEPEVTRGGEQLPLVVGQLEDGVTDLVAVGVESEAVLGWRSDEQVVVTTYEGDGIERVHGASAVDVDTAEVTPLVDFRGNVPSFAADAWSAEVIEAPEAPWAPDPRVVGVLVLIVGTFLVSLFNSVRRRRAGA